MTDLFRIGVITDTHGLKGEVKVFPTTDDVTRFKKLPEVIVRGKGIDVTLEGDGCRYFKQYVILKFKGINDINDVEKYRKCELFVTRDNAIPLEEGEYYISDLIGLKVVSDEGEEIGTLTEVLQTGANDCYEVTNGNEKILLPVIKECVLNVDLEAKIVTVHMMKGLR